MWKGKPLVKNLYNKKLKLVNLLSYTLLTDPTDNKKPFVANKQQLNIFKTVMEKNNSAEIIIDTYRQTGKTVGCVATSLILATLFPYSHICIIYLKDYQTSENAELAYKIYKNKSFISKRKLRHIKLVNGSTIDFISNMTSIRGNRFNWVFLDEASYMNKGSISSVIYPSVCRVGAYTQYGTPCIISIGTSSLMEKHQKVYKTEYCTVNDFKKENKQEIHLGKWGRLDI